MGFSVNRFFCIKEKIIIIYVFFLYFSSKWKKKKQPWCGWKANKCFKILFILCLEWIEMHYGITHVRIIIHVALCNMCNWSWEKYSPTFLCIKYSMPLMTPKLIAIKSAMFLLRIVAVWSLQDSYSSDKRAQLHFHTTQTHWRSNL